MKDLPISEILAKYQTDKLLHGYGDTYQKIFETFDREAELNILEIGVQKGGSLVAWKEYFPNANVYGVDIMDERIYKGDYQFILSDIQDYTPLVKFNIIIDDGSHSYDDVKFVIDNFTNHLEKGGVMIIEDIQDPRLWNGYELIRTGDNYDDLLLIIRK